MSIGDNPAYVTFGLLPEAKRSSASFLASAGINALVLVGLIVLGAMTRQVIVEQRYENTELIFPNQPRPTPKVKVTEPPVPKLRKPSPVRLEKAKILMPKPKPEPKPVQLEAKVEVPVIKAARPAVALAPQPKAAMPAQSVIKPSTMPVHLGDTFGVVPNPNANRPATVAAIGNPYGGLQGPATAPHGVVGSTGIGNGIRAGNGGGAGGSGSGSAYGSGRGVAAVGLPTAAASTPVLQGTPATLAFTSLEIVSKPPVQYTNEARALKIQGDVVLRVTFTAGGEVLVHGVLHSLGHGLDEEAGRVAQRIRYRPATRNGQPIDLATNITITFQLT